MTSSDEDDDDDDDHCIGDGGGEHCIGDGGGDLDNVLTQRRCWTPESTLTLEARMGMYEMMNEMMMK